MTDGRTLSRHARVYTNGYDLSGETRSIGPLEWLNQQNIEKALTWEVGGGINGTATIKTGQVNTIMRFDTTPASSPHDWLTALNGSFTKVMIPLGVQAAPVMGDPVWMASHQANVKHVPGEGMQTITIDFDPAFLDGLGGNLITYDVPWGRLIHAKAARTGANTSTGYDGLAQTTAGGWMMVQFFAYAGTGSATIKLQHADANLDGSFADITGLTTGAIAHTAMPCASIIQAATTTTIKRYLRWQLTLATLTSVTFSLGFCRGR